jgi:hypothetical protein
MALFITLQPTFDYMIRLSEYPTRFINHAEASDPNPVYRCYVIVI